MQRHPKSSSRRMNSDLSTRPSRASFPATTWVPARRKPVLRNSSITSSPAPTGAPTIGTCRARGSKAPTSRATSCELTPAALYRTAIARHRRALQAAARQAVRGARRRHQDKLLQASTGRAPASERRLREAFFEHAAAEHHGRLPRRPDLRRQPRFRRLEADRLSRAALQLRRRDRAVRQEYDMPPVGLAGRDGSARKGLDMATRLPPVDVVLVGFGWTGSIIGQEMTDAGLQVLAIERGGFRDTVPDFAPTTSRTSCATRSATASSSSRARDAHLSQQRSTRPHCRCATWARSAGRGRRRRGRALERPDTGASCRPTSQRAATSSERYGSKFIPDDMTIQDWGVTYEDLEPHYDSFEYLCGISGKAGNLGGKVQDGGNPFEGPRKRDYPLPPLEAQHRLAAVRQGGAGKSASIRFRRPRRTPRSRTRILWTCRWGCAPIAATASGSAAGTIRSRARRRRMFPVLLEQATISSCECNAR